MRTAQTGPNAPGTDGGDILPYCRPHWDDAEIAALTETLRSGMWTGGRQVPAFEEALARLTGVPVVCTSSGTTAVYALLRALGERTGGPKLLISPTLNFAAGPASARLLGWDVALCDIEADDLTIDPDSLSELLARLGPRYGTVVVLPVHYAGHTCDMRRVAEVCAAAGAHLVEDACHAIGATYADGGTPVGSWPGVTASYFSFHPTKPVAAGEGGAVASGDPALLRRLRELRNHGMVPPGDESADGPWPYDIAEPGLNLRISDLHAAVGLVQAARAEESRAERARLAARYHRALRAHPAVRTVPSERREGSAHHLFPVVFDTAALGLTRREVLRFFHDLNIRCQVHYTPLHRLRAFRGLPTRLRTSFAVADAVSKGLVSLPLWRGMTDRDQDRVIEAVGALTGSP
ncbi:DegT/DnrJ/EryC1/StrS family aminotransferase [Streptomyces marincola]|uniref:dTDP-4-amino-4,6-dideoxygalactose transaminase n=1 Tax=Streptomyces marincola TaxID=2878388 RepID=A0A1W7D108_9ACTN|nr:aminotransferase class I/II-fold pyridoxal phosphate-dependent enzyme [Streptomyces marincola]ARQ70753.1 hypothetical protein CAG99_19615 [Streptomyces marincola]